MVSGYEMLEPKADSRSSTGETCGLQEERMVHERSMRRRKHFLWAWGEI